MTKSDILPDHVCQIHDAIARRTGLGVLANGSGKMIFKAYRKQELGNEDKHFMRIHMDLYARGGPNTGCLVIFSRAKLGNELSELVRRHFHGVCKSMDENLDNSGFRRDATVEQIVAAIHSFADEVES